MGTRPKAMPIVRESPMPNGAWLLMKDNVNRGLYEAKTLVAPFPRAALVAARWRGHGVPLGDDTEIVIEGYPRSANSFSVAAFELAQGRPTRIAHHLHAPGHVIAGVRAGVPALVLIRDPEDAILEFVIVKPYLSVRQALRGYLRFYGPLLPYLERLEVGAFREVTTDLGSVIGRINRRFGTSFLEFEHSEENVRICFQAMDRYWQGRVGRGAELERFVGRPSELREQLKDRLRGSYQSPDLADLRARVRRIHDRFLA